MISNRYRSCFLFIFVTLLTFSVFGVDRPVLAQEKLEVRAGDHQAYSRLVFDWNSAAGYTVKKQDNALLISFKKKAVVSLAGVNDLKNIGTVEQVSPSGESVEFSISIADDAKYRHFKIGNRVIIDVYNSSGEPSRDTTFSKKQEIKGEVEEKAKEDLKETPAEPSSDELTMDDGPLEASREASVITMSSTRDVGMAVFERAGFLWIIQDDSSLKIPPTFSSPNKKEVIEFEEIEMSGGKAYRMPKPVGASFYGEGGGLLWRVVVTPNPRPKKAVVPETKEVKTATGVQRSLLWPIANARKVLTLKDPLIGDDITILTVGDSAQTIGPARQMVDMKILPSIVGMALIPYIDDLIIKKQNNGVSLSSARGLVISPQSDTASVRLKDDIEKEKDYFKKKEGPQDISKIYDLNRWEMGGARAFEENRRILMVGAASKQGNARIENLVTMAKLSLANNRGPEALGLLRVAAAELPGIDDTPEFAALHGAAAVLSGKFDEAIESLTKSSIKRYDDVKYWKAAALAGLEDWQQADKVMPTNFDLLEEYPSAVKEPIVLALTEVALRAGNINIAERLLSMLEPEFSKLSVNEQSAWKYLQGEMERQSGNEEQALKNWEQLLTGKDDYYRAKAGLSVTRLQLDRKKITPVKAIDRLEGLRYAWRGDELETVINYHLGQVYIENDDYLKGLSVLRNAVGLSPGSKISQEVTDYMTESFRDLFMKGRLDEISPLDAISIYDEFKELTPLGSEGNLFVQNLAERLVRVDLLGRAAALFEDQMKYRLKGIDQAKVGVRLAGIHLLDNNPEGAIEALDVASKALASSTGSPSLAKEIKMLRARALSKMGESNKALRLLQGIPNSENMSKLRADIAWNGGLWNDAANAFDSLIRYEGISLTRPMNEYQENLVLNRAIALNLSGNRSGLAVLRKRYNDLMEQSEKARIFDLVTRPRQLGILEDRDSIKSLISEVDLFGGFLENYKGS